MTKGVDYRLRASALLVMPVQPVLSFGLERFIGGLLKNRNRFQSQCFGIVDGDVQVKG